MWEFFWKTGIKIEQERKKKTAVVPVWTQDHNFFYSFQVHVLIPFVITEGLYIFFRYAIMSRTFQQIIWPVNWNQQPSKTYQ